MKRSEKPLAPVAAKRKPVDVEPTPVPLGEVWRTLVCRCGKRLSFDYAPGSVTCTVCTKRHLIA